MFRQLEPARNQPGGLRVVFRDGKPSRKEYRHFNIKTVVGANDFASMEEVIGRRYSRLLAEGAELPELIVVDGGKGQLRFAYETLQRLGLEHKIAIVGLAKRIEEVYFPHDPLPYYIDRNSEALKVLMHIRRRGAPFRHHVSPQKTLAGLYSQRVGEHPDARSALGRQAAAPLSDRFQHPVARARRSCPD